MTDIIKTVGDDKRFAEWMALKEQIHCANKIPRFRKGEIWWANIGENIGVEINGKESGFYRPVIVVKKLSKYGLLAVPLTTREHDGYWYVNFEFQKQQEYAVLAQARVISSARLCNRLGEMSEQDFASIKDGIKKLFCE